MHLTSLSGTIYKGHIPTYIDIGYIIAILEVFWKRKKRVLYTTELVKLLHNPSRKIDIIKLEVWKKTVIVTKYIERNLRFAL